MTPLDHLRPVAQNWSVVSHMTPLGRVSDRNDEQKIVKNTLWMDTYYMYYSG